MAGAASPSTELPQEPRRAVGVSPFGCVPLWVCPLPRAGSQRQQPAQEEFMLSHCRKMRNTLQDFSERLTGSVSGTVSHFWMPRSLFSTTSQPGSAFPGSFSVWDAAFSRDSSPSPVLTQGHQSRC